SRQARGPPAAAGPRRRGGTAGAAAASPWARSRGPLQVIAGGLTGRFPAVDAPAPQDPPARDERCDLDEAEVRRQGEQSWGVPSAPLEHEPGEAHAVARELSERKEPGEPRSSRERDRRA